MEPSSENREKSKEEALEHLRERVQNFSPDRIRNPENRELFRSDFVDGVTMIANFSLLSMKEGTSPDDAWRERAWSMHEFARTIPGHFQKSRFISSMMEMKKKLPLK